MFCLVRGPLLACLSLYRGRACSKRGHLAPRFRQGLPCSRRRARAARPAVPLRFLRYHVLTLQPTGAHERSVSIALKPHLPPGKGRDLALTDNHYSMISIRRRPDGYRLRLHKMFVGAAPRIFRALARYVVLNARRASQLLGDYIEKHQHVIKRHERKPRPFRGRTAGRHHDLQVIFDSLNAERFESKLDARITWGPVTARRARRSIKMGSFAVEDRIIRIHPILDQDDVPAFFIRWIVFHEMLHGRHDIVRKGRRRIFHSPAFIADEQSYPDFARATAWEKANLDRLLGG